MKLEQARITSFRCIDDSEAFRLDQVTCLVGKNESGKTSILHALARLNAVDKQLEKFDKDRDYPRKSLTEYRIPHSRKFVVPAWKRFA
jgi:predicted ATP-dependent endonuclease of OLD family